MVPLISSAKACRRRGVDELHESRKAYGPNGAMGRGRRSNPQWAERADRGVHVEYSQGASCEFSRAIVKVCRWKCEERESLALLPRLEQSAISMTRQLRAELPIGINAASSRTRVLMIGRTSVIGLSS